MISINFKNKNTKKIGIFAFDYGGAFNLFLYLKKKKIIDNKNVFFFFLFGPAKNCKKVLDINIKIQKNLKKLKECQIIYYSLSKRKHYEKKVVSLIKKKKIYSILTLDGWGNFKKKMTIDKKVYIPNEIIVFDNLALKILNNLKFKKEINVKTEKNLIFNYFKKKYSSKKNKQNQLLYLNSPVYKLQQSDRNILKKLSNKLNLKLKIRHHPSTNEKKYQKNLIDDFKFSKIVIGHNSSALIYASVLKKKTISIVKNDLYNWEKYSIFKFFKIKKISNFREL